MPSALAALIFAFAVTGCSIPDSTERRGNFQIESFRTDAFGHIATRHAMHHLNGSRRTKVTDSAGFFVIALRDPDRVIYYTCDSGSSSSRDSNEASCRHEYFDGHTGSHHVIGRGLKVSMSALDDPGRWSGSGNYVIIGEDYELVLVNLQSGVAARLTETLQLREPFYPEKWQLRQARWGGWSPEGAYGAVIVMTPHGPGGPPVYEWDEELYSLDAATKTLMLVTTHTGDLGGTGRRKLWRAGDFRWDGAMLQPPR